MSASMKAHNKGEIGMFLMTVTRKLQWFQAIAAQQDQHCCAQRYE